jgi:Uri superfamily endonuclease
MFPQAISYKVIIGVAVVHKPIRYQDMQQISSQPGTYVIVLRADDARKLTIGRAGTLTIKPGYYLYVGSAFGPGGLRARVGRHLAGSGICRWHIDYLRAATEAVEAWMLTGDEKMEHHWARMLADAPGVEMPMAGFGASDCRCLTHLFYCGNSAGATKKLGKEISCKTTTGHRYSPKGGPQAAPVRWLADSPMRQK